LERRVILSKKLFYRGSSESGRGRDMRWSCRVSNITVRLFRKKRDILTSLQFSQINRVNIRETNSNPQYEQAIQAEALLIRL